MLTASVWSIFLADAQWELPLRSLWAGAVPGGSTAPPISSLNLPVLRSHRSGHDRSSRGAAVPTAPYRARARPAGQRRARRRAGPGREGRRWMWARRALPSACRASGAASNAPHSWVSVGGVSPGPRAALGPQPAVQGAAGTCPAWGPGHEGYCSR